MTDKSDRAIVEVYAVLRQLIDAYERVMDTFGSVVVDSIEMQEKIRAIEEMVNNEFADAVTGRNLWRTNAEIHKETADELKLQLKILADQGHRIELDIPIKKGGEVK